MAGQSQAVGWVACPRRRRNAVPSGGAGKHLVIAGGLALYLLGDVAFPLALGLGRLRFRIAGAVVARATIPLGMLVAVGQLVARILVMFVVEAVALTCGLLTHGGSRATRHGRVSRGWAPGGQMSECATTV